MDEAKKLSEGHPHIGGWNADCSIEVYESITNARDVIIRI